MARTSALASIDHADAIDPDDCRTALGEDARRVLSIFLAALKSRAVIFVLTNDESAVIAQERKRKSGGGWCSELIAGITATTSFPGLITLAKIATVFSPIVGMLVRMRSEKFVLSYRNCYGAGEGNRTLVFSLEVSKVCSVFSERSDIFGVSHKTAKPGRAIGRTTHDRARHQLAFAFTYRPGAGSPGG
jgi:hypothetical protein